MAQLEILIGIAAVIVLIPVSVLFVQVVVAMFPAGRHAPEQTVRPHLAILMPAHNEAMMIAGTLATIVPQLIAGDRLLVVADNCSDDTAEIAAVSGAEVIERSDRERRGKGYALDYGIRYLEHTPPEVVIIMDADCQVDAGTIDRLARECGLAARPIQALYLMFAPEGASLKMRIAEFAWLVKNQVRPLGYHRLGLPCQLYGTGMAFPWHCIRKAEIASGHIVEDLKLGTDLALAGSAAQFCPDARVTSDFPESLEGITVQRMRWEHGHLGVILSVAPKLFLQAIRRGDGNLFALALDLCVPPLSLLLMLVIAVFACSAVLFVFTGLVLPLWMTTTSMVMMGLAVLLAWARFGRQVISLASLVCAPIYALWKIPLYMKFLLHRQVEWIRSKRGGD